MTHEQIKHLLPSASSRVNDAWRCRVKASLFSEVVGRLVKEGGLPLSLLYATDDRETNKSFGIHAVFPLDEEAQWVALSTSVSEKRPTYPAVTRSVMAAHWYERYLQDMFGIVPEGHPDPRSLVHHENIPEGAHPLRKDF